MPKTVYVNCPFCTGMMEIDVESGEIINKWSASERNASGGDKMAAALKKIEDSKKKRATLFDQAREGIEGQKKKLGETFEQEVERLKKEGIKEKPIRPVDLD